VFHNPHCKEFLPYIQPILEVEVLAAMAES